MKKYLIKAYGEYDRHLKTRETIIEAKDEDEAWVTAWKLFCEYKEIGVWEQEGDT